MRLVPVLVALCLAGPANAWSAELLMLEQAGCAWCKRWHEEIGVAYPKTVEGQNAPLRRVDINKPWPQDLADIRPERFTPTFVLVEDGKEIGRLRGYAGDQFFWPLLAELQALADKE
ncbi:MAG TPA: transcriptional regulator [Rhizobiaceae bacterium]|nr:transcriptional regulator [Rhizobiaceae bacterium]